MAGVRPLPPGSSIWIAWICALAAAPVCRAQTAVAIVAHPESPGIAIPSSFPGLSFESGSLTSATGFPAENAVFQRMVAQLGPGLVRFGGNSVDRLTGWMRGQRTASTSSSVITSSDADRAFAFARAVGWRVPFSLDLGKGDPATDADEAAYVYQTASDVLSGLEIGNEPDLYHSYGLRRHRHAAVPAGAQRMRRRARARKPGQAADGRHTRGMRGGVTQRDRKAATSGRRPRPANPQLPLAATSFCVGNWELSQPPPSACTSRTLAVRRRVSRSTAVRSAASAVACDWITVR